MFEFLLSHQIKPRELLKYHTTVGVGGECKYFLEIESCQLLPCVQECIANGLDYLVIGLGSNILVSDKGYDGVVIKVIDDNIFKVNDTTIVSSAFCKMADIVNFACKNSLSGFEWAVGLPSSVGGAIFGNAGANGVSIGDMLRVCVVLDKDKYKVYNNAECQFGYRHSVFKGTKQIIVETEFELKRDNKDNIRQRIEQNLQRRKGNQPNGRSMGCVFKNGKNYSAGKLIDDIGLKGFRIGEASVSTVHANFVVNQGGTAKDIFELIKHIKTKVLVETNILLEEEIIYIGEF